MSASSAAPLQTKSKVCCCICTKPIGTNSLRPTADRFCPECLAASLKGTGGGPANPPLQVGMGSNAANVKSTNNGNNKRPAAGLKKSGPDLSFSDSSFEGVAYKPPPKKKKGNEDEGYLWADVLGDPGVVAASVIHVKHAPLSRLWENITEGMKLEVENKDVDVRVSEPAYWVASVIKIQGYYVLLRYEGFGSDSTGDFWMHLCSESIHNVGWCANKGKPLIPPRSIATKFTDWRNFLVNRLTGARTLPAHFATKLETGLKSVQKIGDMLEVVDKNMISQLKVAHVIKVVGRRLQVRYWDDLGGEGGGFWCHEESRLIHPVGWAKTIGHKISHPEDYNPSPLPQTPYDADFENMNLQVGMKLEAIDPLNLSAICAATIKKVLRRGYVMVRIDSYDVKDTGFDWFCYHISSNSVFPCGFCRGNGVTLVPPTGYDKETFSWEEFFQTTGTVPAPIKPKEKVLPHGFREGMKVEVADLMDPKLICVATIEKVVGRLLRVHFDGWEEDYDQWMDARSPDIYPIGWCELVSHRLEPPRPSATKTPPAKKGKKGKGKKGGKQAVANKPKPAAAAATNVKLISTVKAEAPSTATIKPVQNATDVRRVSTEAFNGRTEKVMEKLAATVMNSSGLSREKTTPATHQQPCDIPSNTDPYSWSILDVAQFLTGHDCAAYCEFFTKNNVDGKKMMSLSKDDVIPLTGGKVGPAIKIFDLINQLRKTSSAAKARNSALSK